MIDRDGVSTTMSRVLSRGRPRVQPVSQVLLTLRSANREQTFENVRMRVLDWMAHRAGKPLPQAAWAGHDFELQDVGAQRTAAVAVDQPRVWAGRSDDADRSIPQRTWTTEFGIGLSLDGGVLLGCRLSCVSRGESPPFGRSIPTAVRRIADEFAAEIDGIPAKDEPLLVDERGRIESLVGLLTNPKRRNPVVVVAQSVDSTSEWMANALQAAREFCPRVVGAAHVVVLSEDASYGLTDALGREFSVFSGAVRTYRAGFDPERDEPGQHPLALPASIASWDQQPGGFLHFLVDQTLRQSVVGRDIEAELPSFAAIRSIALSHRRAAARESGKSDKELLALALDENDDLRTRLAEDKQTYEGLLSAAESERDEVIAQRDAAKDEVRRLRDRVDHLLAGIEASGRQEDVEIPSSLDSLESWANQYLSGHVTLLNRAVRAAKKSEFEEAPFVYRTLLALRDHYVPMRRLGGLERKQACEQALRRLGLEEAPTFAGTRAGQQGDEYIVDFGGRRRELDRHLKGSNSRDPRFGFRLYFFWDDDGEQVVVGWLPTHLTNNAS